MKQHDTIYMPQGQEANTSPQSSRGTACVHARDRHSRLPSSQFAWGGSQYLAISVGCHSHAPFTWAVCELHTERRPTTLLKQITLGSATQYAHHCILFMALVSGDRHFGNSVQSSRLRCSGLS